MDRGVALLALAAGGVVLPLFVRPGEGPKSAWPQPVPFKTAADVVDILQETWREAGKPPLVGVAMAVEGSGLRGRFNFLDPGVGPPLEAAAIMAALHTSRVHLIEVRVASAMGAPQMSEADRSLFCAGAPRLGEAIVVVAAEINLATAFAVQDHRGEWVGAVSEAQRLPLTPDGDSEAKVLGRLRRQGLASAGAILCRGGLSAIHGAVADIGGAKPGEVLGANRICELANLGDPQAIEATSVFSGWLGAFAREAAMSLAARGGVYLAGPLVRAFDAALDQARFEHRFRRNDLGDDYLDDTPVWRAVGSTALRGLSTLFSASDARVEATGVLMLDC